MNKIVPGSREAHPDSMTPGSHLLRLCDGALNEVILVAPFIKEVVLARLLNHLGAGVVVRCVTRWWPHEIASGVSDVEIWHLLQQRGNSELLLKQNLHAKYYRADTECFIGSANLTQTALGWKQPSNLELLVALPSSELSLAEFEKTVMADAVSVDNDLYRLTKEAVSLLPVMPYLRDGAFWELPQQTGEPPTDTDIVIDLASWSPTLRHPPDLYHVYQGRTDIVTRASFDAATADLAWMNIPPGLTEAAFRAFVAVMLLQQPIIRKVDEFVATAQRFGAVRQFLRTLPCARQPNFDPSQAWQTLMRWLLYFVPSRYEMFTPNHSEIFRRRT